MYGEDLHVATGPDLRRQLQQVVLVGVQGVQVPVNKNVYITIYFAKGNKLNKAKDDKYWA